MAAASGFDRQTDTPTWRAHARAAFFPRSESVHESLQPRCHATAALIKNFNRHLARLLHGLGARPLIRAHDDFTTGRGGSLRHQRALQLREALADVGACAAAHAAWQVLHIDVLGYFLII